jgi:hypothetical protein
MWRVADAAGEAADTVLRLSGPGPLQLILFRNCGEFNGDWSAGTSGVFVGMVDGWSGDCIVSGDDATPGWLARAHNYRVRGAERDLLAADGTVVARLLPGGKPPPAPNLIETLQRPPTLDPATAQKLRTVPRSLPAGVTPASDRTIPGTWTPSPPNPSQTGKQPFLEFETDGSWTSYDGCNGGGGRWALGTAGDFVSIAGATAGVGCNNPVTDIPLQHTRRAAVSGDVLTLYDTDGRALLRLDR